MKDKFLIFSILLVSITFGFQNKWYCIPVAGYIDGPDNGASAGQTAIGDVAGYIDYGDGTYGFWHHEMMPEICFEIDHENWYLDSIDVLQTSTMEDDDRIEITNCGNCHLCFGLRIINTSPISWAHGYNPDIDRFVTRAKFMSSETAPDLYDIIRDYIKDVISWSSPDYFGPQGYDFAFDRPEYLYLQFQAPTFSSEWGENMITMELSARVNLP